MANLVASNFIYFLSTHYNNENRDSLISTISEFYLPDELITAKQILIEECEKLGISESIAKFKKRRQLLQGDGIQKVIKDLIDIWSVIDLQKAGNTISTFVIDDPKRLPSIDNNSQNFRHVFSVLTHLQKQVADIGNIVTRIDKRTENQSLTASPNASLGVYSETSFSPSSSRTLPWKPMLGHETRSPSLKRKLNSSATSFIPSKQKKGKSDAAIDAAILSSAPTGSSYLSNFAPPSPKISLLTQLPTSISSSIQPTVSSTPTYSHPIPARFRNLWASPKDAWMGLLGSALQTPANNTRSPSAPAEKSSTLSHSRGVLLG